MDESLAAVLAPTVGGVLPNVKPLHLQTRYPLRLSALACVFAGAGPMAFGQAQSTTVSTGYMESYEYTQGEININYSYQAFIIPQFNGNTIGTDLYWFDYYDPRVTEEGAQRLARLIKDHGPALGVYDVGGAEVEVLAWQPLLTDAYDEFIDSNYETRSYTTSTQTTTVQLTSGDGPDPYVPIGNRGECFSEGTNGPTNFDTFTGFFADCSDWEEQEIPAGTLNTYTHSTFHTIHVEELTGNEDWQAQLFYSLNPGATRTTSIGTHTTNVNLNETQRVDHHTAHVVAEIGGRVREEVEIDGEWSDSLVQSAVEDLLLRAASPNSDDGAPIVLEWADPVLAVSTEQLVKTDLNTTTGTRVSSVVTNLISAREVGDTAVEILIGDRGECTTSGASGIITGPAPTGQVADCGGGIVYSLSEGESNTHTHTTILTEQLTTTIATEEWLFTNTYLLLPRATQTRSWGSMLRESTASFRTRVDSYATRFKGQVNGTLIFDTTVEGALSNLSVRQELESLTQPTGYGLGGTPVLIRWSEPQLSGSTEHLVRQELQSTTTSQLSTMDTTQVNAPTPTSGERTVFYGDRGECGDAGQSGIADGSGRYATCSGGIVHILSPEETNTHIHTTHIEERLTTNVTTDHWLTTATYQLEGEAVSLGQHASAVVDILVDDLDFGSRQRAASDALTSRSNGRFVPWLTFQRSEASRDSDVQGPGHERRSDGVSIGLVTMLSSTGTRAGVAFDHSENELEVDETGERSDVTLIRVAANLALVLPLNWQLHISGGHARADVQSERETTLNGGLSMAEYQGHVWFSSLRLGPQWQWQQSLLRPFVETSWSHATLDSFVERGPGVLLIGSDQDLSRTELVAGLQFDWHRTLSQGSIFGFSAELVGGEVLSGTERERTVAFASMPAQPLLVSSAEERSTFGRGALRATFSTPDGIQFHLGMDRRYARDQDGWRATAGVAVIF